MSTLETFIKNSAPGGLYGEWAKKEECWIQLRNNDFSFDLSFITPDLVDKKNPSKRTIVSDDEATLQKQKEEIKKIKSIPSKVWKKIEDWGRETENLSSIQQNIVWNLSLKVRNNSNILPNELSKGIAILDIIIDKAPELLFNVDNISEESLAIKIEEPEITLELINKMVDWDKVNKRLQNHHFRLMFDIINGKAKMTTLNKKYCMMNFHFISKWGFKI